MHACTCNDRRDIGKSSALHYKYLKAAESLTDTSSCARGSRTRPLTLRSRSRAHPHPPRASVCDQSAAKLALYCLPASVSRSLG